MDTALKLVEVGVIGAGVAAFCWWQFRDLRIEREKAASREAALAGQAGDPGVKTETDAGAGVVAQVSADGRPPMPQPMDASGEGSRPLVRTGRHP